jgi:hypothetical protein
MTEKIRINNKDMWVVIEPHLEHKPEGEAREYFTASYYTTEPLTNPSGVLFINDNNAPHIFQSPVEALEYATEKLLGLL